MMAIYIYYKRRNQETFILSAGITIAIAGAISALICTIFWNGTLDYIYLKPYFVFDLKDIYLNTAMPCIIIHAFLLYKKQKKV